ncbi:MAG: hypothetical protein ACLFN2_04235 [Bacteroidales bacterium]
METKGNVKPEAKKNNEKIYRIAILVLGLLVLLLGILWFTSRQSLKKVRTERAITEELNRGLQHELDSVLDDYYDFKMEYDSVLADKDSVIQANAEEIQDLIRRQEDYYRIRRQLNMLREITQNYVHEIDSLHTENRVLKSENVQMRDEIEQVTRRTTELTEDKQQLESQVEMASELRAYQIDPFSFRIRGRGREFETDRARRVEQIRVCFLLGENPIVPAGELNIYMRIADPDGNILRLSDTMEHAFLHNEDTLQYSVSKVIDYQNEELNTCLTWQRTEEFEPGVYAISLFTDEHRLGETALELR